MEENIRRIAEEIQGLSKVAVAQYRSAVDDIINETGWTVETLLETSLPSL